VVWGWQECVVVGYFFLDVEECFGCRISESNCDFDILRNVWGVEEVLLVAEVERVWLPE
jgi:hypothetical protein